MQPKMHEVTWLITLPPNELQKRLEEFFMLPGDEQAKRQIEVYQENFEMIVEDLVELSDQRPILAEGVQLLPELVVKVADAKQVIVMDVTEDFLKSYNLSREAEADWHTGFSNPEQTQRNRLDAHIAIAEYVREGAQKHGLKLITTTESTSVEMNVQAIADQFGLSL